MNKTEKAALIAWQGYLIEKIKDLEEIYVLGQDGENGQREKDGDAEKTRRTLSQSSLSKLLKVLEELEAEKNHKSEEKTRYCGLNRPSLLRLLEVVEELEAEKERDDEEWARKFDFKVYNERTRWGMEKMGSYSYLKEDRKRLMRERRIVTEQLRDDQHLQRTLVLLDSLIIVSPSKLAYFSYKNISAGSETVFCRDHIGIQRMLHQIARDRRRQQIRCDLGLANQPEVPNLDPDRVRLLRVQNNDDMWLLLEYLQAYVLEATA